MLLSLVGGDTGSDCIGTSNRQGAKSVTNFELMPKPAEGENRRTPMAILALQIENKFFSQRGYP